jgi:hypothetical protein
MKRTRLVPWTRFHPAASAVVGAGICCAPLDSLVRVAELADALA